MPTWSRAICCRQPRCARPRPRNGGELAGCVIAPPFRRANACLDRACRDPQRKASHFSPITSHRRVAAKKARGLSRAFRRNQGQWRCLKSPSVLPPTLVARIFFNRLFLSAAECPFFDTFFLWFGSHMSLIYNNMSEISPVIFCERTR
jgi:hypothetical protein